MSLIARRKYKRYSGGGDLTGTVDTATGWGGGGYKAGGNPYSARIQYDANGNAIDPIKAMFDDHKGTDASLTGAATSASPWGALASVGSIGSKAITGKGENSNTNAIGNLANPWNQFEDNRNAKDWAASFLNPLGSSFMKGDRLAKDVAAYKDRVRQEQNRDAWTSSNARVQGWDAQGSNENSLYHSAKYGGRTPITSLAIGGHLNQLNSDSFEVEGNSHEQGGVKFPAANAELEGGESGTGDFIFSEELGFAQKHKPIARAIGKIEQKPDNKIRRDTISLLKQKEEKLAQEQEMLKEMLGLGNPATQYIN